MTFESPQRIEPVLLENIPTRIADRALQLAVTSVRLADRLHPRTAANLADLVRITNTYYSNLIEGHNTRPHDIERALAGDFEDDPARRDLQIEAGNHVRVQASIDRLHAQDLLPEPASADFLKFLHREFYEGAPETMLRLEGAGRSFRMVPGEWRSEPLHDVAVGAHVPPSSARVADFMAYFEDRYRFAPMGRSQRIVALAAAHHRFAYIHPFPDGNGRVGRLMSHAMAHKAGIGAHGLWSISRGLARGLESRREYRQHMAAADTPRQGDLDGRGNLSQRALCDFIDWFLTICTDQVRFMSDLYDLDRLLSRLNRFVVERGLRDGSMALLEEALLRGEFERGDAERIARLPARSARRVLTDLVEHGLLNSETPKGPVSLRFPVSALDILFPALFVEL